MVMQMYSLLLKNPKSTKAEIESAYDGNICRCTGYRPILDAMKTFSIESNPIDIEEIFKMKCLNNETKACNSKSKCCSVNNECNMTCSMSLTKKVHIISGTTEWYTPKTLDDLYDLLNQYKTTKYRLVGGNTG